MLRQVIVYNAIGILNTVIGLGLIVFLMFLGYSPIVSNMIGYGVGALVSYLLNSKYTFGVGEHKKLEVIKFFVVLSVAYGFNMFTLQSLIDEVNLYMAQAIAAIVYSISSFFMLKILVFKTPT